MPTQLDFPFLQKFKAPLLDETPRFVEPVKRAPVRPYVEPRVVSEKLIISGRFVEHYKYEKPVAVGFSWPKLISSRFVNPPQPQTQIRDDNVRRTRQQIRRLVNSNQDLNKFMTLTFGTPVNDLSEANPLFHNFIKRLSRLYPGFKYLCVPEFQPRSGRVHYHLLCNLPFVVNNELTALWGHGFTFIRKIDSVDNLGAYVCKYLGKANFDPRYFRKRKFFYSFNLVRALVVDKYDEVVEIIKNLPVELPFLCTKTYEFEFSTKWLGVINYSQYRLARFIKVGAPPVIY